MTSLHIQNVVAYCNIVGVIIKFFIHIVVIRFTTPVCF